MSIKILMPLYMAKLVLNKRSRYPHLLIKIIAQLKMFIRVEEVPKLPFILMTLNSIPRKFQEIKDSSILTKETLMGS